MEQKDIDRLLICRAAVDKQREFNKARVEAYTTCKSVTEAKTLIESKVGAMTITADSAVKTADGIKSTLEAERTKMTLAMYDVIKGQGFESYTEFSEFNDKANFDTYKECRPIYGICDLCGLEELKDQPCFKKYGMAIFDCAAKQKEGEPYMDGIYMEMFRIEKEDASKVTYGDLVLPLAYCPKGHGYQVIQDKCKDFPFDVFWRA